MIVDGANETDVREEIATPLLSALGYVRGTGNDILREYSISYNRNFLGRKKDNDPPLRGRADYVLSVAGAGRWVLEIKAPSEDITPDVIDQAISYARHPEVAGTYAAILNGKRFVVVHSSQRSTDRPILDIHVHSWKSLAEGVMGFLSPEAIRRDCSPPIVDLGKPLMAGFRSSCRIDGGFIAYSECVWESNIPLPDETTIRLNEMRRILTGYRASVVSGRVWRDETSRIRARLEWNVPHDAVEQFVKDKGLMESEFVSLDPEISNDARNLTRFDVIGHVNISEGESIFDISRWDTEIVGIATSVTYRGQALGYIRDMTFFGTFQTEYECAFPSLPIDLGLRMYALGTFEVSLDPR